MYDDYEDGWQISSNYYDDKLIVMKLPDRKNPGVYLETDDKLVPLANFRSIRACRQFMMVLRGKNVRDVV